MPEVINGVAIEVVRDYEALSQTAAKWVLSKVAQTPETRLLVPTGTTPEGLYALLSEEPQETFDGVTFFNLDEYCEPDDENGYRFLDEEDTRSYRHYMSSHILRALPTIRSFFPGIENVDAPGSYDRLISNSGGIDLAINSIGEDGHVFGFNIPGSAFDSVTRLIQLNESTRTVNEGLTGATIPTHAISTGIATGLAAREVITILAGERKADILRRVVWDDISPAIPATVLRQHPNHTFIVDEAAASKL
jgi:glucosamine-6-phosphate deaminase